MAPGYTDKDSPPAYTLRHYWVCPCLCGSWLHWQGFSTCLYSKTLLSLPMSLWLLATLTRIIPPHKCQEFPVPHYRLGRLVCWNEKPTYSPPFYTLRHYWVCPCLWLLWQGSFHHTSVKSFQCHITDWEGACVEMENQLILHQFVF